ncbi:uncharacterized protein [Ptychodera flava]|uniref:uncharacterized protein n=1 Tax=Ptychodera flava TaxID=63121 RepID=UPI00396A2945
MEGPRTAHNIHERQRTTDVLVRENVDFAGLLLTDVVQRGLANAGFERPSPIQLKAIPLGRCGLDLIVQAKSGTGKTCVFSVIALESLQLDSNSTQVLILAPTREIAVQIQDVILSIGSAVPKLRCHVFIGGLPLAQDKVKLQKCHVAVGTPGRIKQLIEEDCINTNTIRLFVLDEADKLLDDKFKEQINWIYSALPDSKQMLALSATYPEYLAQQLTSYMRDPVFVRLNPKDLALQGLVQYCKVVPYHSVPHKQFDIKVQHLLKLLSQVTFNQCLVFSNYQTRAQNLSDYLCSKGWPSTYIAGSQDQSQRLQAMSMLKKFQCRVLISTDLTARGIDAERVNLVVNLDVPYDSKTYLHRIGRAGRFGTQGIAVTYTAQGAEYKQLQSIRRECHIAMKLIPETITSDFISKENTDSLEELSSGDEDVETQKQNGFSALQNQVQPSRLTSKQQCDISAKDRQISKDTDTIMSSRKNISKNTTIGQSTEVNSLLSVTSSHLSSFHDVTEGTLPRKSNGNTRYSHIANGIGHHREKTVEKIKKSKKITSSKVRGRTQDTGCQTETVLDHTDLCLGVIKPLHIAMRKNKHSKLTVNYQNAVKDFKDFLETQDTDFISWKRFYEQEDEEITNVTKRSDDDLMSSDVAVQGTQQLQSDADKVTCGRIDRNSHDTNDDIDTCDASVMNDHGITDYGRDLTGHRGLEFEEILAANTDKLSHLQVCDSDGMKYGDNDTIITAVQSTPLNYEDSDKIKSSKSVSFLLQQCLNSDEEEAKSNDVTEVKDEKLRRDIWDLQSLEKYNFAQQARHELSEGRISDMNDFQSVNTTKDSKVITKNIGSDDNDNEDDCRANDKDYHRHDDVHSDDYDDDDDDDDDSDDDHDDDDDDDDDDVCDRNDEEIYEEEEWEDTYYAKAGNYHSVPEFPNSQDQYQYYHTPYQYMYPNQNIYPYTAGQWNNDMYSAQHVPTESGDQNGWPCYQTANEPYNDSEFQQPSSYGVPDTSQYGWEQPHSTGNSGDQMLEWYDPYLYQAWVQAYQAQCYYNQFVAPPWQYGYW